jgi:hypothetical protein
MGYVAVNEIFLLSKPKTQVADEPDVRLKDMTLRR